jgi:FkbM family methyltransferase
MALLDLRPVAFIHHRIFTSAYRLHEAELDLVRHLPRVLAAQGVVWPAGFALGLDIGAGLGPFSHHMLRWCRTVVAIEPNAKQAAYLRRVFGSSIHVAEVAVSDRPGQAYLIDQSGAAGTWRRPLARISSSSEPAEQWHQPCSVDTVDRLVAGLTFAGAGALLAKIDVEGHELAVLHGMTELLAREPALLIVEIESRLNPDYAAVFQFLEGLGFSCFVYENGNLVSASLAEVEAMRNRKPTRFGRLTGYRSNYVFLRRQAQLQRPI